MIKLRSKVNLIPTGFLNKGVFLLMVLSVVNCGWTKPKMYYLKLTKTGLIDSEIGEQKWLYDPRLFQNTPLWNVARSVYLYDIDELKKLLSENKFDLNEPNPKGLTVLSLAILYEREATVPLLLEHGADPNYINAKVEEAPIHQAATKSSKVLKMLLDYGGNPNLTVNIKNFTPSKWSHQPTPLSLAAKDGLKKNVELLLEAGADVNYGNGLAVEKSLTHHHLNITLILLQNGFELNTELSEPVKGVRYTIDRSLQYNEKYSKKHLRFNQSDFNKVVAFLKEKGVEYQHVEPKPRGKY